MFEKLRVKWKDSDWIKVNFGVEPIIQMIIQILRPCNTVVPGVVVFSLSICEGCL